MGTLRIRKIGPRCVRVFNPFSGNGRSIWDRNCGGKVPTHRRLKKYLEVKAFRQSVYG